MAVTINDIKKLRDMTGAGLSDCKKALIESDNDITKAMELIRKRGQAIAAKRAADNARLEQEIRERKAKAVSHEEYLKMIGK